MNGHLVVVRTGTGRKIATADKHIAVGLDTIRFGDVDIVDRGAIVATGDNGTVYYDITGWDAERRVLTAELNEQFSRLEVSR